MCVPFVYMFVFYAFEAKSKWSINKADNKLNAEIRTGKK